jgi:hypothetical protein
LAVRIIPIRFPLGKQFLANIEAVDDPDELYATASMPLEPIIGTSHLCAEGFKVPIKAEKIQILCLLDKSFLDLISLKNPIDVSEGTA